MRLNLDGVTPNTRLTLVDCLETDDGYAYVLRQPFFLRVGERIGLEKGNPVITRTTGERFTPAGDWETRCYS